MHAHTRAREPNATRTRTRTFLGGHYTPCPALPSRARARLCHVSADRATSSVHAPHRLCRRQRAGASERDTSGGQTLVQLHGSIGARVMTVVRERCAAEGDDDDDDDDAIGSPRPKTAP